MLRYSQGVVIAHSRLFGHFLLFFSLVCHLSVYANAFIPAYPFEELWVFIKGIQIPTDI